MLFSVSHEPSLPYQFLVYRNEWSGTLFLGLRSWDGMHTWISFSTFYPTVTLFSHDPLTQDTDCLLALWRLLFFVIPLVTVVICLFFVLSLHLKIQNTVIRKMLLWAGPLSLAVYLIHLNPLLRYNLFQGAFSTGSFSSVQTRYVVSSKNAAGTCSALVQLPSRRAMWEHCYSTILV